MNQPTREEFEELKQIVHKLQEQMTEPMKVTRIELDPGGIQNRLDNHAGILRQISQKQDKISTDVDELKLDAKAHTSDAAFFKNKVEHVESDMSTLKTDVGMLKTNMEQVKTDIGTIKTIQNGHSKFFEEHGRRLNQVETSINQVETSINQIEATMATKDDISQINTVLTEILNRTTVALLCGDGGLSGARKLSFSEEVTPKQANSYLR